MNWPAHQCRENTASFHGRHLGAPKNPLLACQNSTFFQWMFFWFWFYSFFVFFFEYGYPCCFWLVSVCNLWKMSPKWDVTKVDLFRDSLATGFQYLERLNLMLTKFTSPPRPLNQLSLKPCVRVLCQDENVKMNPIWVWKSWKRPLKPNDFLIQLQLMSTWQSPKPNLGEKNMESKNK